MTRGEDWAGRVGEVWAAEWRRTDRSFRPVDAALVGRVTALVGTRGAPRLLDVGCGAGATSLSLAAALPAARVTGIDLSPALVAAARERAGSDARLSFAVADAADGNGDAGYDLLVSRHGVMFFADPVAAFARLRARAAPGARMIFSCFRAPECNAWTTGLAALARPAAPPDPHAPGPFAFADPARVAAILAAAGWRDAAPEPLDYEYLAGEGDDPVADAVDFLTRIGPTVFALGQAEGEERERLRAGLAAHVRRHVRDGRVVFPAAAWIWSAAA